MLPIEVEYIGNVSVSYAEYFSNQWVWTTLNPVIGSGPQIIVTSDENYNNTGRTRVRIEINPFVLTQRSLMSIRFDTTVKPGVTNTIQNNMLIGNEGKSIAYPPYLDTTDQDGDGITNEQLLITNTVYNNVLFSTKYASDKKVKGALDTNYTQWPDVGNTYNGGPAAKLLPVEPEKVGIQVKLPGKDTVTLGDFVWIDENHDGIYDNGEVGINGAVINLYDSNKVFISTTTTTYDSNNNPGYYSFKNIDPGEYYIEFIPPDGYVLTVQKANEQNGSKPDRTTGFTDLITTVTTPGSIDMTIDAGVYPSNLLSSVGDLVWIDSNKNGVYDPGEKGQAGVVVTLYDENGVRTDYSAITDSNGKYLIDKVIPQKYYAVFSNIPQDYLFVTAKGYVTNTGVTPKLIDVPSGTFVDTVDAPIAFNDGLIGPPGLPGPSGCCYTYNILNSIYLDNQEVKRGCTVNLGCSAVNNGEFSSYENNSNYVILNGEGTFMIDYSCYGEFLETPNEKDYIALQLKLNNDFILQGYSYTTENGVLRCR